MNGTVVNVQNCVAYFLIRQRGGGRVREFIHISPFGLVVGDSMTAVNNDRFTQ